MKIRSSFVSNSSSCSFCIYGVNMGTCSAEDYEKLDELFANTDVSVNIIEAGYGLSVYIGREFSSIRDDETGREFKESTEKLLKKILGDKCPDEFGIIERAWENR